MSETVNKDPRWAWTCSACEDGGPIDTLTETEGAAAHAATHAKGAFYALPTIDVQMM